MTDATRRRQYGRRYAQARRDRELAERQRTSPKCPRRQGTGICGGTLEVDTDALGRTLLRCVRCVRRKSGICQDCPAPVAGHVGKALRCARHQEAAKRLQVRASEVRHRDEYNAKWRAEYAQMPADEKARRNALKAAWRKANPEKVRAQKQRYVERHRSNPKSGYNRYHARYRAKYRHQKRGLERDRLAIAPPPRKTSPQCAKCGRSTRWTPILHGGTGRPWTKCAKCIFPCERAIRRRNRRRAHARAKAWFAAAPATIKRPPGEAKRGPGWERLCITPGCETVLTHRRKKCRKCLERDRVAAQQQLAPHAGRGRRTDIELRRSA